MAQTTLMAATERVATVRLRDEFNCRGFSFFEQQAVLRRSKNESRRTVRFCAIGIRGDFEPMIVVNGGEY